MYSLGVREYLNKNDKSTFRLSDKHPAHHVGISDGFQVIML